MRARRTDDNLKAIYDLARKVGLLVYIRNDIWDLDVTKKGSNRWEVWEVKNGKGGYRPGQEKMIAEGWPVYTVRTAEDVLLARKRFL
jgi:hypothetical protein